MYTHPHIASQLAYERQRDRLARVGQQRLVRQFRDRAEASRPAPRAGWRLARSLTRRRPVALPS